jgi:trehalose utilization protein
MSKLLLLAAIFFACALQAAPIRVVVWDEQAAAAKNAYTNSIGDHIAEYLRTLPDLSVKSVSLAESDQGLSDDTINNCDVIIWWSRSGPSEKEKCFISAPNTRRFKATTTLPF